MNPMNSTAQLGAHETVVMHETLCTKATNVELLSMLMQQSQDPELRAILGRQVQIIHQQYQMGVDLMQRTAGGAAGMTAATGVAFGAGTGMTGGMGMIGMNYAGQTAGVGQIAGQSPQLGLHNPYVPAPQMHGGRISDRAISAVLLNVHKHGAVSWMQYALECANRDLRQFLVNASLNCDRMAYETWAYMNQKGYYQVPTMMEKTTQTMVNSFNAQPQGIYQ